MKIISPVSIVTPKGPSNIYAKESILQLLSLVPSLQATLKTVAPRFLKLGQTLQSINSEANQITQLTLDIVQTSGKESDQILLNNVAELAKQSLTELKKTNTNISQDLKNVEVSIELLDRLHRSLNNLRSISKTLGIVSLNIAIESSRSGNSEKIFSFFVEEINDLSNRVNIIFRDISNDSKESQIKQQLIWTHVIYREKELQAITSTADNIIEGNIEKIKKLFENSRDKFEKSTLYTKEISRHIGEIIESIQFEDITRQQIEHIIEAIQDLKEQYNDELCLDDAHPTHPQILTQIYSFINIQAAQVEQVIYEIREAHKKILNSFSEISILIDLLVEMTTLFSSKNQTRTESGASFEELISDFTNLDIVLDQGHNLSNKIEEAMLKSEEIALQLSSHIEKVEEISLDLHIKAINAIIMSNQLGPEGVALSVLAKNVTYISKESNDFVTEVVEIINSISGLTEKLNSRSESDKIKNQLTDVNNEHLLDSVLDEILKVYNKFQEDSSLTFNFSTSLKETLMQAKSDISFLIEMAVQLETCLVNINMTAQSLEPYIEQTYLKEISLNQTSEKYTMKVERDIHNKIFNNATLAPSNDGDSQQIKDIYDDFGDNVELF